MDSGWYIKHSTTSSTHEDLILGETFSVHDRNRIVISEDSVQRKSCPIARG